MEDSKMLLVNLHVIVNDGSYAVVDNVVSGGQ